MIMAQKEHYRFSINPAAVFVTAMVYDDR